MILTETDTEDTENRTHTHIIQKGTKLKDYKKFFIDIKHTQRKEINCCWNTNL